MIFKNIECSVVIIFVIKLFYTWNKFEKFNILNGLVYNTSWERKLINALDIYLLVIRYKIPKKVLRFLRTFSTVLASWFEIPLGAYLKVRVFLVVWGRPVCNAVSQILSSNEKICEIWSSRVRESAIVFFWNASSSNVEICWF